LYLLHTEVAFVCDQSNSYTDLNAKTFITGVQDYSWESIMVTAWNLLAPTYTFRFI